MSNGHRIVASCLSSLKELPASTVYKHILLLPSSWVPETPVTLWKHRAVVKAPSGSDVDRYEPHTSCVFPLNRKNKLCAVVVDFVGSLFKRSGNKNELYR